MNLNEAINTAAILKNQFRAFEKLEEVLRLSGDLDTAIAEKQKQVAALDAKAAEAKHTAEAAVVAAHEAQAQSAKAQQEAKEAAAHGVALAEQEHEKRLDALNAEYHARCVEIQEHIDQLRKDEVAAQEATDAALASLDAAKKAHAEFLSRITKVI